MNSLTRRQFLTQGAMGLSLAAVIAACGDTSGPTDPGRIGTGDEGEELPGIAVDDAVLARTAQSLHHSAAAAQQGVLDSGLASKAVTALLPTVIEAHVAQAERLAEFTGGAPFECPNPFATDRYVDPAIDALNTAESTDKQADANKLAIAFEEWVARSQQDMVSTAGQELRNALVTLSAENNRHSVLLSLTAEEEAINPLLEGGDSIDKDEAGYPIYYALPARFGLVSAVPVVVGAPDAEGQRFSLNLATPADNTYVNPDATCSA